ncbi:uncharacterized protein LOC141599156 [Silene latifolia]|uniref:uncharacterized protein LOC141599156 n=1 Tax=Silene latifolia TaxID=37657 RepID=UPI003D786756
MSIQSLDNELGKLKELKAQHIASDVECRRLERELEIKNDELKELIKQLGFSKDAEAKAIKRYDKAMEFNNEVEAKLRESMAQHLPWNTERRRLELKIIELDDLVSELKFSKNAEARAGKKHKQALEYNQEVEAKLEDLRRGFNEEKGNLLGKLTETEAELANLKEKLKGDKVMEIGGNSKADPAFESLINHVKCPLKAVTKCDETAKATALSEEKLVRENTAACDHKSQVRGLKRPRASSVCSTQKNIDDSSSDASDYRQHPQQPKTLIYLKITGNTIAMAVDLSLTVDILKSKIQDISGIAPHKQRLSFVGYPMGEYEDPARTLAQYHIQKESTLECGIYRDRSPVYSSSGDSSSNDSHKQDAEQTKILIFVETICGTSITMRVEPSWTIRKLKSKIEKEFDVLARHQVLVFEGNDKLENSRTLSHYDIRKDSTIYLLACRVD